MILDDRGIDSLDRMPGVDRFEVVLPDVVAVSISVGHVIAATIPEHRHRHPALRLGPWDVGDDLQQQREKADVSLAHHVQGRTVLGFGAGVVSFGHQVCLVWVRPYWFLNARTACESGSSSPS